MRPKAGWSGLTRRRNLMFVALSFAATATCVFITSPVGAADQAAASLVEANQRRFQAMIDRDLPALEEMLHEDLVYTHSTGAVESRRQALDSLGSGRFIYRRIEASDLRPIVVADTGIITGLALMQVAAGGKELEAQLRFTAVYVRSDHSAPWRLIAWQSARIEPSPTSPSTGSESDR